MRQIYKERRDALIETLRWEAGTEVEITVPEAGMHLAIWLPVGMKARTVTQRTTEEDLPLLPISAFGQQPLQRDALLLGFANASLEELRTTAQTLARDAGILTTSPSLLQAAWLALSTFIVSSPVYSHTAFLDDFFLRSFPYTQAETKQPGILP